MLSFLLFQLERSAAEVRSQLTDERRRHELALEQQRYEHERRVQMLTLEQQALQDKVCGLYEFDWV